MSTEQNARDPFVGLTRFFDGRAREQIPAYYAIGKILSVCPMRIRAAGMDLDRDDLRIAQHLLPGWTEHLTGLGWPVKSTLPRKTFYGQCECGLSSGEAWVVRPEEEAEGKTAKSAAATHDLPLAVGDEVLLIPSADGQIYYIAEKLVEVTDAYLPSD